MRRSRVIGIVIVVAMLAAIGAAAAYYVVGHRTGDVHKGLDEPFTLTSDSTTTPTTTTGHSGPNYGPPWPFYGRTLSRTRDASDLTSIHPPYRVAWKQSGGGLLEYPATYAEGVVFEAADSGLVTARNIFNGKLIWHHKLKTVLASPAIGPKMIYLPSYDGRLYALSRKTGRTVWSHYMGGMIEGSPALWHGRVFEGTLSGTMRAFNAFTGRQLWSIPASGAVKQGPAVVGGRLFFGDYGGTMWCVQATNGHVIWRTHTAGLASGFRSGSFFSTPAVAYGRVYIGNTDGKVYSFVASTGVVAWTVTLPDWAYGSPAVSAGRVFATAYDGTFVALNARTGAVLWRDVLPYRTLASPVLVGRYVYVADKGPSGSARGQLFAYNPGNGKRVWYFPDGKYSTVSAGAGRLIVAGFGTLYALQPR
ncbi:MAG: outer membrane protein assembly factor BamB family protein [Gaiellales bacterium]